MTLNIKDHEAHKLAQAIAQQTGETMTHAVKQSARTTGATESRSQTGNYRRGTHVYRTALRSDVKRQARCTR